MQPAMRNLGSSVVTRAPVWDCCWVEKRQSGFGGQRTAFLPDTTCTGAASWEFEVHSGLSPLNVNVKVLLFVSHLMCVCMCHVCL